MGPLDWLKKGVNTAGNIGSDIGSAISTGISDVGHAIASGVGNVEHAIGINSTPSPSQTGGVNITQPTVKGANLTNIANASQPTTMPTPNQAKPPTPFTTGVAGASPNLSTSGPNVKSYTTSANHQTAISPNSQLSQMVQNKGIFGQPIANIAHVNQNAPQPTPIKGAATPAQALAPAVSAPIQIAKNTVVPIINTAIVDPAKQLLAQATGNKVAEQNAANEKYRAGQQTVNILRGLTTRPAAELALSLNPTQQTFTPNTPLERGLFGSQPVQNIEKKTAQTYQQKGLLPAIGEAAGSILQDAPVLGGVIKVAAKGSELVNAGRFADADIAQAADSLGIKNTSENVQPPTPVPISTPETPGVQPVKIAQPNENLAQIQNAGGRPPLQQQLEDAHNQGDVQTVNNLINRMDDNDPYKPTMQSVFADDIQKAQTTPITKEQVAPVNIENGNTSDLTRSTMSPEEWDSLTNSNPQPGDSMYPYRNADAERAAIEQVHSGGTLDDAVRAYSDESGSDGSVAEPETIRALQEARETPPLVPLDFSSVNHPGLRNAAEAYDSFLNEPFKGADDAQDLLNKAGGTAKLGQRLANNLARTIKEVLPDAADRQAVRDLREGSLTEDQVKPEVAEVANVENALGRKELSIRQAADPRVGDVENYSTRLPRSKLAGSDEGSTGNIIRIGLNKLSDLFNTDSRFNESRSVGKYVDQQGNAHFGNPETLGLSGKNGSDFVDKQGNLLRRAPTTAQEIENSGVIKYEKDSAKIAQEYHGDTAKVRARQNALNELLSDPAKYGLTDYPVPGSVEIDNVPELWNTWAPKDIAGKIEDTFSMPDPPGVLARAWQGINRTVTQFIVLNPVIHGLNLYMQAAIESGNAPLFEGSRIQSGPVGFLRFNRDLLRMGDPASREQMVQNYLKAGGHYESYGKDTSTVLTKALERAGIPKVNKVNSQVMSGIDATLRSALHNANVEAGMRASESVKQIDTFLGSRDSIGPIAQNMGMFYHWLRTQATAIGNQLIHPVANAGANVNALIAIAAMYGANTAFQEITGNKNAHLRVPGELGLANELIELPGQIKNGQEPTVITNHINPVIQEIGNQLYGKDLYTGKTLMTGPQRLGDALQQLFAPTQSVTKVAQGKSTPTEIALNEFGAYTPHTAGHQAAPNINSGILSGINVKNALPGTGEAQAQAWYNAVGKAQRSLGSDQENLNVFNTYLQRTHNAAGQSVQEDPAGRIANAKLLFSNDTVRNTIQQVEKAQPNHDPMWDLPADKLKTFLDYQSQYTADPERSRMEQQSPWLADFVKQRATYYSQQTFSGNSVPAPNTPSYPAFDPQTTTDLSTYNGITDSTTKSDFLGSHPNIINAFNQIAQYDNQMRVAEGALPLQGYPTESRHISDILNNMPQGTDSASKKARALLINGNPDVNQYLADVALYDTTKNLAGYYLSINPSISESQELNSGTKTAQQTLKDISSLGAYDIAKNAAGNYQFMQGGAFSPGYASSSGSSSSSSKSKKAPLVPLPPKTKRPSKQTYRRPHLKKVTARNIKLKKTYSAPIRIKHAGPLQPSNVIKIAS